MAPCKFLDLDDDYEVHDNHDAKQKNIPQDSYWGWIPALTHFFIIDEMNWSEETGYMPSFNDIQKVLEYYLPFSCCGYHVGQVLLSGSYVDRILNIKHQIGLKLLSFKDNIIKLEFKVNSPTGFIIDLSHPRHPFPYLSGSTLFSGVIDIWNTGMVKYEIHGYSPYGYSPDLFVDAIQIHKIICRLFNKDHTLEHDLAPLILPPVRASDYTAAVHEIALIFLAKFKSYMDLPTVIKPKYAIEYIYQERQELEFAQVFFDRTQSSFTSDEFAKMSSSLVSHLKSCDVLLGSLRYSIDFSNQKALSALTYFLVAFSAILIRSETLNILQNLNGNIELPNAIVITIDYIVIFVFLASILLAIKELKYSKKLEDKKLF